MATNLATAYVSIVPSMQGVQGQLMRGLVPAVGPAADKAGREGGKRMGSAFSSALKGVAATAAATMGFAAIVGGMKSAITEAGNLEQSVGAVSVIFKDQAATVDRWSRDSAKSLGLSRNAYNEFATLIGSQLKNAGVAMEDLAPKTDELITLGADMAAMFGGSTSEAVEALSSALKGERDPIEKYGVSLNQAKIDAEAAALGFEKVGGSLSQEANAAATMSLIMKQTTDAHGTFAREANTYAGQVARLSAGWDDLKAKVGELFLPVMTDVVSFLGGTVVPILGEVSGGVRAFRESWKAADGDVTSSGFPGFMERAAFVARSAADAVRDYLLPPLESFAGWLQNNATTIGSVVAVLAAMTAGFYANAVALAVAGAATAGYSAILSGARSKILTARIAVMYFNAALLANPVGLVVAALAGLVVAIVLAWKHSETFRRIVTGAWDAIKRAAGAVADWWTGTLVPGLMSAWDAFSGFFSGAWDGIRSVVSGVTDWWAGTAAPLLKSGIDAVGGAVRWLHERIFQPAWYGIRVVVAVVLAVVMTIMDGFVWLLKTTVGPIVSWLYEKVVKPSFEGWRIIIGAVVGWITGTAFPAVTGALSWVGDRFSALWSTVRDVWKWIRDAISAAWTFLRDSVFRPLVSFLVSVVLQTFRNFQTGVQFVWTTIRNAISAAWTFLRDAVFRPLISFLKDALGPAFSFLYDRVIRPAWDSIRDKIAAAWSWIRDRAFRPMADFAKNTLGAAFRTAVDAITKAWDKVKKAVSGPVDFVINTVINGGFIKNFNTIAKKFGIDELDEISFKGFREGGRTGGSSPDEVRGLVHGREFVATDERTREADRLAPGFLDDFHEKGFAAAAERHFSPALGSRVYEGQSSFANVYQGLLQRTRQTNVGTKGYVSPVWGVGWAANSWNGMAGIQLDRTNSPGVRMDIQEVGGGYFNYPNWAGMYTGVNDLFVNRDSNVSRNYFTARAVTAHEIGHALGLPHTNSSRSIMNPTIGQGTLYPTAYDAQALRAIYPGPAKGTPIDFSKLATGPAGPSGPEEEDRGGLLNRLGEWLRKKVGFDALVKKIPGGEFMKDLMKGAAEKAWDGFKDWTSKALDAINPMTLAKNIASFLGIGAGAGATGRPTVFDGGGWLEQSAQPQLTWHREQKPDAVLTNADYHLLKAAATNGSQPDGRDAPLVGTLNALDTDDALRKLRDHEKMKEALHK